MKYKIWSIEHNQWWDSEQCGYTNKLSRAGVYYEKEAKEICRSANQHNSMSECIIPVSSLEVGK
jgi:hypothetical protein